MLVLILLVGVVVSEELDTAVVGGEVFLGKQVLESHEGDFSVEVGGLEGDRHRVGVQHGRQQIGDYEVCR